jgi:hypothetical protein
MKANKTRFKQLPNAPQVLPSECLECGSKAGYAPANACKEIEFRKETFEIEYMQLAFPKCGDAILSDAQMTDRSKKVVAAYQVHHGLLTAHELIRQRRALGYNTQRAFLKAASKLPEATLKRIESGLHAQDASTDALFRQELEHLEDQMLLNFLNEPMPEAKVTMIEPAQVHGNGWDFGTFAKAACITTAATFSVLCTSKSLQGKKPEAVAHKVSVERILC